MTVGQSADAQGVDLIRKAISGPEEEAYLAADRVRREVCRLQVRLGQVQARGGAYRRVELSEGVRDLLARLEAGATLSTGVH